MPCTPTMSAVAKASMECTLNDTPPIVRVPNDSTARPTSPAPAIVTEG